MYTFKKIGILLLAVVLISTVFSSCRASKRQGCPTWNSIELNAE